MEANNTVNLSERQAAAVQELKQELSVSASVLQQINKAKYESVSNGLYRILVLLNSSFITGKLADLVTSYDWKDFGKKLESLGVASREHQKRQRRSKRFNLIEKISGIEKKLISDLDALLTKWMRTIEDEIAKSPQTDALFEMVTAEVANFWEANFKRNLYADKTLFMYKTMGIVRTPALREIVFDYMDSNKAGKISLLKFEETCEIFGMPNEWDKTVPAMFKEPWFLWHPIAKWSEGRMEKLLKDEPPYTFAIRMSQSSPKTAVLTMMLKNNQKTTTKVTWNGFHKFYFLGKQFPSLNAVVDFLKIQIVEGNISPKPFSNQKKRDVVEQQECMASQSIYSTITEWTEHLGDLASLRDTVPGHSSGPNSGPSSIAPQELVSFKVLAAGTKTFESNDPIFIASNDENQAINVTPYNAFPIVLCVVEQKDGFVVKGGHPGLKFSYIVFRT